MTNEEKTYIIKRDIGINFVKKPDAITNDDDTTVLRAELSCGHAVDPNSLTAWCRSLIDSEKFEFFCPAIIDGITKKCNKKWPYSEVRKLALLNEAEKEFFESKLSEQAAKTFCEWKECPNCSSFVERLDLNNLRVFCTICAVINKKPYEFCWQCENEWIGSVEKSSQSCYRPECVNKSIKLLKDCKFIKLSSCKDLPEIPSIRACPTCGILIEHDGTACKNIFCNRCSVEFCFACLEKTVDCQKSNPNSWYGECSKTIAKIQTTIPVWKRN